MAAYDFPDTTGQPTDGSFLYTAPTGELYSWNGYAWVIASGTNINVYVKKAGDTMSGALSVPANAISTQVPQVQEVVQKSGDTMTGDLTAPVVKATDHIEGVYKELVIDKAPAGTDTTCTFEPWMKRTVIRFDSSPQDGTFPNILQFGTASAWLPINGFTASEGGAPSIWGLHTVPLTTSTNVFAPVAVNAAAWSGANNMTITWVNGVIVRGEIVITYSGRGIWAISLEGIYQFDNPTSGWGSITGASTLFYRAADDITKVRIVHVSPTANYPIIEYKQYA